MKKILFYLVAFAIVSSFGFNNVNAQVTVTATAGQLGPDVYTTLKQAFDSINVGRNQGAITISISANTTETAPAVLNSSGAGAASYTSVLIQPTNDAVSISGATATGRGLIELNGADNVTIDGDNPNTLGTNRDLTIQNTAANTITFTSVIRLALSTLVTSADNNTVRNVNIKATGVGRNTSSFTTEVASWGIVASGGASTVSATTPPSALSSATTTIASGQTVTNLLINNNGISTASRGVSVAGAATSVASGLTVSNNLIGNPTAGNADQVTQNGITISGSANAVISGNTVYVESFHTTNSAIVGIDIGTLSANTTGATIQKNIVQRVQNNNTATYGAYGININGGVSHSVINNSVLGILNNQVAGTGAFSTTFGVHGIRIGVGGGHKILHNSVHLAGVLPGSVSTNLASCFTAVVSTDTSMDVRNNIFSNVLTGGNATLYNDVFVSIYLPSGLTSAFKLLENNNAYYQGTLPYSGIAQISTTGSAANLYLASNFSAAVITPSTNLRAYTSTLSAAGTNDNASIAASTPAPFASGTNLHINTGLTPTKLESGGASAGSTGVTTDIDNQTRPGPAGSVNGGATAPDLGFDEFDGVPSLANDIQGTAFIVPLNGGTVGTGISFSPQASFTNNGTAAQTNVTVRYRIINASFTVIYNNTQLVDLLSGETKTVTFSSTSIGTNGAYQIKARSELVGDQAPANDSIAGTITVTAPLAGDYTVGLPLFNAASGRNLTFERVVTKVMREVYEPYNESDSKKSNIVDRSKFSDLTNGRLVMKEVEEVSYVPMENGLPYDGPQYIPATDNSVGHFSTLTAAANAISTLGSSAPVRFLLTDATYPSETFPVTINQWLGSSATNTLTIQPDGGVAVTISGNVANGLIKLNGADYVTVDGLNTGGNSLTLTNTNVGGVDLWIASASVSDGATNNTIKNTNFTGGSSIVGIISGSGSTLGNDADAPNSFNTIQGNVFKQTQNALYLRGNSTTYDENWVVTQNTAGSAVALEKHSFRGFAILNSKNFSISQNTIAGVTTSTTSTASGIACFINFDGGSISKNKVSDVHNTNTGGYGSNGIYLGASTTASNITVSNNFIWDVSSYGYLPLIGAADNGYGIIVDLGGGYNIYYNSISLNTNQTVNSNPVALNVTSGVTTAGSLNIRDNIFSNTETVGTNRWSVYSAAANTVYADINYNDYYYGTAPNLGFLGSAQANLAAWKVATGKDANSISGDPLYINPSSNLHIDSTGSSPVGNAGTPIAGITTDIDGNTRNVTTPDIGADEFNASGLPTNNVAVTAILNPLAGTNILTSPTIAPQATITNVGTANQTNPFNTTCTISPGGYTSTVAVASLLSGASVNKTYANFSPSTGVLYTVTVYTQLVGDINTGNDTLIQQSSFIFQNYGNDSGYFYANNLATTQPSYPKYNWKDTTGSLNLVLNTIQAGGTTLVGTLDDGYFKLSLKNILLALGQDTTDKHVKYNGICFDSIFPTTNGIVGLTEAYGTTSLSEYLVSSTLVAKNALLPLWKDFDLRFIGIGAVSNRVSYKAKGNQLIVTYDKVGTYNSAAASPSWTSYQIVLDIVTGCGSSNSNFRFTYADTTTGQASGTFVSTYESSFSANPPTITTFGNFISGYSKTGAPIAYGGYVSTGPLSIKRPIYNLTTNRGLAVEFGPNQNNLNKGDGLILSVCIAIQGLQNDPSGDVNRARDTVQIYIRDGAVAPYKVFQKVTVFLDSVYNGSYSYGRANIDFSLLKRNYPYYLEVTNKQTLESWSTQVSTAGDTLKYDFTTGINKTFGNNAIVTNGVPSFYTGDITSSGDGIFTQDGQIDLSDLTKVFNDASAFLQGPNLLSDLNQDGYVDLTDLGIVFNNSTAFIQTARPAGAQPFAYEAPVVYQKYVLDGPAIVIPDPYLQSRDKSETEKSNGNQK